MCEEEDFGRTNEMETRGHTIYVMCKNIIKHEK